MILFIDDEKRRMKSYVEELELSSYQVKFISDVDSAVEYFKKYQEKVELIILDIMMPTGNSFNSSQTGNGLRTGVPFYEEIRKQKPILPIIIFTNVYDEQLLQYIDKDNMTLFCEKDSFIPIELATEVRNFLPNN